jgi:hypothetical protein
MFCREEWHQLCRDARDRDDLGELRRRALLGSLRASRFRSVSWRLLLRLLPPDPEAWVTVLHDQREHYMRLSTTHHVSPALTADDNPLSQDTQVNTKYRKKKKKNEKKTCFFYKATLLPYNFF